MIKKFTEYEKINEWYNEPNEKDIKKNQFGFFVPSRTYLDKVFDHIITIVCHVNKISEKDYKGYDRTHIKVKEIFDNTPDIILDIKECESKNHRYEYCAEFIYEKYFKSISDFHTT